MIELHGGSIFNTSVATQPSGGYAAQYKVHLQALGQNYVISHIYNLALLVEVVAIASMAGLSIAAPLSIPPWLPTEPGGRFAYELSGSGGPFAEGEPAPSIVADIIALSHDAKSYAATVRVTITERRGATTIPTTFDIEATYDGSQLRLSGGAGHLTIGPLKAQHKAGDLLKLSSNVGTPLFEQLEIISTTSKIALGGKVWNDAWVVETFMSPPTDQEGARTKVRFTLGGPEGLLRGVFTPSTHKAGEASQFILEIAPQRRPFD